MNRRGFIRGVGALFVAAPAIVRASSLMEISPPHDDMVAISDLLNEISSRAPILAGFRSLQIYRASPLVIEHFEAAYRDRLE